MKRYLTAILLTVMLASLQMTAQTYESTPVEISKEKVKVDGKICYSHVVLERQTLYSISKAYEVSIDDIYLFNPTVKESGLKKNSIIIIPSKEAVAEARPQGEVKPQEKAATEIKTTEKKAVEKTQRIHIAKWYEDLDVIADKYGITVEELMAANNLKGRKLSKRHRLIIPFPGEQPAQSLQEESALPSESLAEAQVKVEPAKDTVATVKNTVNATLMLPLTTADGKSSRNNMDFYSGVLLATYDLGNSGINCNLSVYDIMDSSTQISIENIENSDVIIGPISAADITRLYSIASGAKAIVSPLDQRVEKLVSERTELIQIPTPYKVQYEDLAKWIEQEYSEGDRVIMISEKGSRQSGIAGQMKEVMDSTSLVYSTFSYSILEGRDVTAPLTELMTKEGRNRVLIASESEAFVNDVVRNLNLLIYENIDIVLYAPAKIRSFDTIEVENMHNTSMRVSLNYYIDYEDGKVKDFVKKYRALFGTEPSQYAFQGYDIAAYCIEMIATYGDGWKEIAAGTQTQMLQNTMALKKQPFKGYINNGVRRIVYEKGYSVIRAY